MEELAKYEKDCVAIYPEALNEEFARLPADLAFWNEKYSNVYRYWLNKKLEREVCYAQLYGQYQNHLMSTAKGRVTVGEIEAAVTLDQNYQRARMDENAAEAEKIRLYGLVDSIRRKADMLVSIGAHQRAEMHGDPMIRRQEAIDKEVQTQGGFGSGSQ